jgi:NADPH-dependent curcumin reductase CurA
MASYSAVHLRERPKAGIIPGQTFELKKHNAPKESDLKDGEVIFQSLYLSLDPAMRGWLNGRLQINFTFA